MTALAMDFVDLRVEEGRPVLRFRTHSGGTMRWVVLGEREVLRMMGDGAEVLLSLNYDRTLEA